MLSVPLKRMDSGVRIELQPEKHYLLQDCLTWRTLPGLLSIRSIALEKVTVQRSYIPDT
jgi:hypothetical protein